jgi:hypothetical protein
MFNRVSDKEVTLKKVYHPVRKNFDAFRNGFNLIVDIKTLPAKCLDGSAFAIDIEGPVRIDIDDWELRTSFQGYSKRDSEDIATR